MKNILNSILLLVIISIACSINLTNVSAIGKNEKGKNLDIYKVKAKEDILVNDNDLIAFYKNNSDKKEIIEEEIEEEVEEEKTEIQDLSFQNEIVNFALQFVGNPYVSGGTSLTQGADCSGFVQSVFANYDIVIPRTTYDQAITGEEVSIENILVGDIISYGYDGYVSHSALYIGDGMIVHSSTPELGIRTDNINIMPIITIRRIINV